MNSITVNKEESVVKEIEDGEERRLAAEKSELAREIFNLNRFLAGMNKTKRNLDKEQYRDTVEKKLSKESRLVEIKSRLDVLRRKNELLLRGGISINDIANGDFVEFLARSYQIHKKYARLYYEDDDRIFIDVLRSFLLTKITSAEATIGDKDAMWKRVDGSYETGKNR